MARTKTPAKAIAIRLALAGRITALRTEMFGERGRATMARRLGVPLRTWHNYEEGKTIPAEVILRVMEMTLVEADWLLNGRGPKYRLTTSKGDNVPRRTAQMVHALVKEALELFERGNRSVSSPKQSGRELDSQSPAPRRRPRRGL
jgi:hypothetical protein